MFLFLFLLLSERSTRCFQTIAIIKRFINDFVLYLFSIIVTTLILFFVLIFFHIVFFVILIEIFIFFKKFILNLNTLCLENIKQFLIFNFNEIKSSFRCFRSFFKLNQKIFKSSHFRVDDVRVIMCDIINYNNYIANATLLFDIFAHASDIMNIFYQRV